MDGKETFGYMVGEERESKLFVSHLVIVDQIGTHSSCEPTTKGNEQFSIFQTGHPSLKLVGWSHTHPM